MCGTPFRYKAICRGQGKAQHMRHMKAMGNVDRSCSNDSTDGMMMIMMVRVMRRVVILV